MVTGTETEEDQGLQVEKRMWVEANGLCWDLFFQGGCENGWRRFNRPSGGWCIRVFGGRLSRPNAEAQCQSYGATLSGLQNYEEIQYITSQAVRVVTSQSTTSVWVGAQRKAACARQGLTATCNGQTSFGWTDGSATGTAGFIWDYKQPDNAHNLQQNCAVVLAARTPTVQVGAATWKTNYMDDTDCDLVSSSLTPRAVLAYVCGKVAR